MRGLVLGGTASGVGKTIATLAVTRALERAGHTVQPAKGGPDFIDPSHHAAHTGTPSRTLDPWLQGPDGLRRNYWRGDGDICVVEGMMGLYDGSRTSTADVASILDVPVVLVVDASAGMQSVAATALGFREFASHAGIDVDVAGVIAQQAHGGRHEAGIRDALPEDIAYLGRIPPHEGLEIPDRHLGLVDPSEAPLSGDTLDEVAAELDAERLYDVARTPERPDASGPFGDQLDLTVAVPQDDAFRFIYPRTREVLRERATVETFSPVSGDDLPACDAVYLPGGYPELHAADLADAPAIRTLGDRAADGLPVFGECGGFMAIAESLTVDDIEYRMAGVLPADVEMHDRYQALGHVELEATRDSLTAPTGGTRRAHEFHYSSAEIPTDARFVFDVDGGTGIDHGRDGLTEYQTLGTYAHVHPESGAFDHFLDRAADHDYRTSKTR